ncbi:hypothetical protein V1525DRAFT_403025 [Lipomyces kononenkoae]|uniref:Uncharacterized protein n=1 Tax=Lipomyces kononenkoae TaxID=34357 RepID=A0ACC3T2B1_LIPKO
MQFKLVAVLLSLLVVATAIPLEKRGSKYLAQNSFAVKSPKDGKFKVNDVKYQAKGEVNKDRFKVKDHYPHNKIHDKKSHWHINRDLPSPCSIGTQLFWFFDDSFVYAEDGKFVGAASNSVAIATDVNNPSDITDVSITLEGEVTVAIPWTQSEEEIQYDITARYAFWTYGSCIPIDWHHSWHFWTVVKFYAFEQYETLGYTLAQYEYDETKGSLAISRQEFLYYDQTTYSYGAFASVYVSGVLYLYALDPNSEKYDVHVASVPTATANDKSTWTYWQASTQSWSTDAPNGSVRDEANAAIVGKLPFSTGSVFWSDYHNAFLLVFFSDFADSIFYAITAPTPVGPWDTTPIEIVKTQSGANGYNYGGQATPVFYGADGQIGQRLVLSYTYQDNSSNWFPASDSVVFA